MHWYQTFVKRILSGLLLFLLPLTLLIVILVKAVVFLRSLILPIKNQLPSGSILGIGGVTIVSLCILVIICFIAGILIETKLVKRLILNLEDKLLVYIPGYSMIKSRANDAVDESENKWQSVLVKENNSWRLAVEVDRQQGGYSSIFIPNPPNARAGMLKLVHESKLKHIKIPVSTLVKMVRKYGEGSAYLVDDEDETTNHSKPKN